MKLLLKEAIADYKKRTGKNINLSTLAMRVYKNRNVSKETKEQRLSHLSSDRAQYIATLEEVMRICIELEIDYTTFINQYTKTNSNGNNQSQKLRSKKADRKIYRLQSGH